MENLLKKFKTIEPKEEFKKRSLALILSAPQNEYQPEILEYFSSLFTAKTTLAISAAGTILIIASLSLINSQLAGSPLVSSLDQKELNKEIEAFNIQLSQVRYYEDSAKKIEVALMETSGEYPINIQEKKDDLPDKSAL